MTEICFNCGKFRGAHFPQGVRTRCPCPHGVAAWPWVCHQCELSGTEFKATPPGKDPTPQKGGHPRFHELLREMASLHDRKNADYAQGGRPLGNFERVGLYLDQFPGLSLGDPVIVALTYLMKQLDAALWMLSQGHESKTGEGVDMRLQDVAVYAVLARVLWEEGRL